jgi:hypothetical protein
LVRNAKSQHNNSRGRRNENIAVEVPKIKEVKGETHKTVKIDGFERSPPLNANVLFGRFSLSLTLFMTKLRVLMLSFPDFADTSTMHKYIGFKRSG